MTGPSGLGGDSTSIFRATKKFGLLKDIERIERAQKGTVLITEGDAGDCMYIVKTGMVEITKDDQLLDVLGPGEIIGEMSMLDGSPRSATVTCSSDCEFFYIDQTQFQTLVTKDTDFFGYCMKVVTARLRRMNDITTTLMNAPGRRPMQPPPGTTSVERSKAEADAQRAAQPAAPAKPTDPKESEVRWGGAGQNGGKKDGKSEIKW